MSEFFDMRFRRRDVSQLSKRMIANDRAAFCFYLENHGKNIAAIAGQFIANSEISKQEYYRFTQRLAPYCEVSFEGIFSESPLKSLREIARVANVTLSEAELLKAYKTVLKMDNKTKVSEFTERYEREQYWSDHANTIYKQLRFPELERLLGYGT